VLPDDRGRERDRRPPGPDLREPRPWGRRGGAHARAGGSTLDRRTGVPALRTGRRGPLREDGAQRHRIRADGRLCRGAEPPGARLDIPVIGGAGSQWGVEQLRRRARDSIEEHGGIDDPKAFERLSANLGDVDGDYREAGTFAKLREALGGAGRPAHYLAIPPSLFEVVVQGLGSSGCSAGARVIVEKPFGRDLASAEDLNRVLHA